MLTSLAMLAFGPPARAADPDALWKLVHGKCVPGQLDRGDPKPCALIDMSGGTDHGVAVLKDLNGVAQFLLIPTERITGIEDPALQAPSAPNFFAAAWNARTFVEHQLNRTLPRDAIGLVINSIQGRTQEQMHIHIDCLRADVRETLEYHVGDIGQTWAPFPTPLVGRMYMAMWVSGEQLGLHDPFKLLATGVPGAGQQMGLHTLIVAALDVDGTPGFVVLDRQVAKESGDRGNGTELLDRSCGVTTAQAP